MYFVPFVVKGLISARPERFAVQYLLVRHSKTRIIPAMMKKIPFSNPTQTGQQFLRALQLVWRTAARWTVVNALLVAFQGLLPLAALYLAKRLVDLVTASLAAPDKSAAFAQAAPWLGLAALVALLTALARSVGEYAAEAQSLQVTDAVADILHAQSIAVDLNYYEDPGYYDTLHRAQKEAPFRPTRIVNGLIQVAQNGLSLLAILALLVSFNWWMPLLLLFCVLPGAFLRLVHSRRLYRFDQSQTEHERKALFYHYVLTDVSYAKELRLFDLGGLFRGLYSDLQEQIRTGKLSLSQRRVRSDLFAQTLVTAALFGSLAWVAWQTLLGQVTLGDLLVYYLGFQSGLNFLQSLLRALAGLYEDNLFLTNLYRFLDLRPQIIAPPDPRPVPRPLMNGIRFDEVSFTYPGRAEPALRNINLTIAPSQVIALVGENGSGKTTLIKLLCRLYDPTQGTITVDGVDLRQFDPLHWRRELGITFQDYAHYALSVKENIWLGYTATAPDPARIALAAQRSGADEFIRRLPNGYDTMLGHWFNKGQELSGGEWQKLALARTFWREANLLVLDEPTSALDAIAEEKLFNEFRALLNGHSGVLISHRFSTVQMADCIYVLDQGHITESGSHAALLAQNGHYARLYHSQAQYYQE